MKTIKKLLLLAFVAALTACASVPTSPSIAVMPAPGKPFEIFQQDDATCKSYAHQQLGRDPNDVAGEQVASGIVVGSVIGAAAGTILGDRRGGTATGVIIGAAAGSDAAAHSHYSMQNRYDIAYSQCMYAKGNQVPGYPAPRYSLPPRRRG
jgi:uncharacterized protein YcfJ